MTVPPSTPEDITCVPLPVLEDKLAFEGEEFYTVTLLSLVEGAGMVTLGNNTTATVYIQDNDSKRLLLNIICSPIIFASMRVYFFFFSRKPYWVFTTFVANKGLK